MVVAAAVTAGGTPISGASLTFSDSLGSTFMGSTASTNSSGVALTTVQFNSGNTGVDFITASASKSGYTGGVGSNIVTVLPSGATQLSITPSVLNRVAAGGSTNIISGKVSAGYSYNYNWVAGAQVTITDTIGSIFNVTSVLTDNQGYFSASFVLPSVTSTTINILTVSTSLPGYSGSSSAVYMGGKFTYKPEL